MYVEIAVALLSNAIKVYGKLKKILDKYGASNIREILSGIRNGRFAEHPTYEDYLEARSYELELKELLGRLDKIIAEMRRVLSPDDNTQGVCFN